MSTNKRTYNMVYLSKARDFFYASLLWKLKSFKNDSEISFLSWSMSVPRIGKNQSCESRVGINDQDKIKFQVTFCVEHNICYYISMITIYKNSFTYC
jgi:hypothetical protein